MLDVTPDFVVLNTADDIPDVTPASSGSSAAVLNAGQFFVFFFFFFFLFFLFLFFLFFVFFFRGSRADLRRRPID